MLPRTRAALAVAAAVIVAASSVAAAEFDSTAASARSRNVVTAMPLLDSRLVATINAARAGHGLPRLRVSVRLRASASYHSYEMAGQGFFSHDSLDGTSPSKRLARFYTPRGYRKWQVGETLLWWSPDVDAARVVHEWLANPQHHAILLAPAFREIGVSALHETAAAGDFQGDEVTLITADFGVRRR